MSGDVARDRAGRGVGMIGAWELDSINHCDLFALCDGLPDASVDMVMCDLPYGTTACHWDSVIPIAPMWERFKRVIKPRGAIVLTASQPFTSALVMSNVEMFRYEWVWRKSKPVGHLNAHIRPMLAHESVLVFSDGGESYYPQGVTPTHAFVSRTNNGAYGACSKTTLQTVTGFPNTVLEIPHDESAGHPTQKPLALFRYLIRTYTREGELVLDPCVGSGTTALAARNAKRHWICGDSDAHYCDVARDRLRLPFEPRRVKASDDVSDLPLFATERGQP